MSSHAHEGWVFRDATASDARAIALVEAEARSILEAHGVDLNSLTIPDGFEEATAWSLALVAEVDGSVAGMARASDLGHGVLALDQVSVLPAHSRAGIGRKLLEATARRARDLGYRSITGTTFRDLRFNAPFYAGLHAVEDADPHPVMLQRRAVERQIGLDRLGERIIMRLNL